MGFLLCSSCAYQMGLKHRQFPGGYDKVSIPVFENRTQHVGAESYFTNALVREFHRSKIVKVVPQSLAPVFIEGHIQSIDFESSAFVKGPESSHSRRTAPFLPPNTVLTTGYRVRVKIKILLLKTLDRTVVWQGSFNGEKAYPAPQVGLETINTANPLYNYSARNMNLQKVAQDMMSETHDRMMENF